jgi:hypothetical protein
VTYKEPSKGASGEVATMSKADFLASWDGYAITQKDLRTQDTVSRVLSASEAMKIRGSDPFLIFGIISVIFAIASTVLSFIDNEVAQLLSKVFAIVSLVTGVLNIVVNFQYIINGFATGLQNIGQTLTHSFDGMMALFKNGVEGFVTGVTAILGKAVTGISLNMSYNKALTTFGLNSDLAGITSAFLAGGFSLESPSTGYFSLTGAFSNFTLEGVRFAGRELGLDPTITGIIGTSAATIVSAGLGGVSYADSTGTHVLRGLDAISYTIGTTVLPNVASELAYYGITKLGEAIGIDSIVSQIAGIGIRSTISAGLRGYNANDIFKTALGGMAQGLTSIGINYATQELGLNPLLANIGFSAIAAALNAGIQTATGGSQDVFKTFFDTYINNALTFLGYGNITDPNYAWLEASYKAQILDFSDIVRQKGIVEALNIYGTSFFNSTTVGAIAQSGMTIGKYFDDKISKRQYVIDTTSGGVDFAKIAILKGSDIVGYGFFSWDGVNVGALIGKEEIYQDHTFWGLGGLGKDSYGSLGFWNDSTLMDTYSTFKNIQKIENGDLTYANVQDLLGNDLIDINPLDFGDRITWNAYGEFLDAKINDTLNNMEFTFEYGNLDNTIFGSTNIGGITNPALNIGADAINALLFSTVDNGKIVASPLVQKSMWSGFIGIAEAAENTQASLSGISDAAIAKINHGETVNLASLASSLQWQAIFNSSNTMKNWANTAMGIFFASVSPNLTPGVELAMNIFGSETLRQQLKDTSGTLFDYYSLYGELASVALGNPPSAILLQQIGNKDFWEGVKSGVQFAWANKDTILQDAVTFTNIMFNTPSYFNDVFWQTDIGKEFIAERNDFFCLSDLKPYVSDIDPVTKTIRIDPNLNYANLYGQPVSGALDLISLVRLGNVRWDISSYGGGQAASGVQNKVINGDLKGISISGINTNGADLDTLTKDLALHTDNSFVITNSAGISSLTNSNLKTDKVIATSPQEKRQDFMLWADSMGYTSGQLLIVDVKGDLPYRPQDLVDLDLTDLINPANIIPKGVEAIYQHVNDNAYHDYGQNLDGKYTYVQIIAGPGVGVDPVKNHGVTITGALDENAEYTVSINGVVKPNKYKLKDIYTQFLNDGEIK